MTEQQNTMVRQIQLDFADSIESLQPSPQELLTAVTIVVSKILEAYGLTEQEFITALKLARKEV